MTMRLLPLVALVIIMLIFLGYFILTSNRTKPVINNKIRVIMYILPSKLCSPKWHDTYGDRIYFYVYESLEKYSKYIEDDFKIISRVYNTVAIMIPAEDTPRFFSNLKVVSYIASKEGLKVLWVILPKSKYGPEDSYLEIGTKMHELVIKDMKFLSSLNSTWRIAVWYGWKYRTNPLDVINFFNSLPNDLKKLYVAWIDEGYVENMSGLANYNPRFPIATELYSKDKIARFSGLFKEQIIVTGFYGAESPEEWLKGISEKISLIKGSNRILCIWIFYDIGDGHGEEYATYRPKWNALPDPYNNCTIKLSSRP